MSPGGILNVRVENIMGSDGFRPMSGLISVDITVLQLAKYHLQNYLR